MCSIFCKVVIAMLTISQRSGVLVNADLSGQTHSVLAPASCEVSLHNGVTTLHISQLSIIMLENPFFKARSMLPTTRHLQISLKVRPCSSNEKKRIRKFISQRYYL